MEKQMSLKSKLQLLNNNFKLALLDKTINAIIKFILNSNDNYYGMVYRIYVLVANFNYIKPSIISETLKNKTPFTEEHFYVKVGEEKLSGHYDYEYSNKFPFKGYRAREPFKIITDQEGNQTHIYKLEEDEMQEKTMSGIEAFVVQYLMEKEIESQLKRLFK